MIEQNLTLEKALSRLEGPMTLQTWELDHNDPFVFTYAEGRRVLDNIFEKKLADHPDVFSVAPNRLKFLKTKEALTAKKKYENISKELASIFNQHFTSLKAHLILSLNLNNQIAPHDHHFIHILFEMLINSIEHGSDFCKSGEVIVETRLALNGAVCSIVQPQKGPSPELIQKLIDIGQDARKSISFLYSESKNGRGNGFKSAIFDFKPPFWFENLGENGTQTIMLETRQRVEKLFEDMKKRAQAQK